MQRICHNTAGGLCSQWPRVSWWLCDLQHQLQLGRHIGSLPVAVAEWVGYINVMNRHFRTCAALSRWHLSAAAWKASRLQSRYIAVHHWRVTQDPPIVVAVCLGHVGGSKRRSTQLDGFTIGQQRARVLYGFIPLCWGDCYVEGSICTMRRVSGTGILRHSVMYRM